MRLPPMLRYAIEDLLVSWFVIEILGRVLKCLECFAVGGIWECVILGCD